MVNIRYLDILVFLPRTGYLYYDPGDEGPYGQLLLNEIKDNGSRPYIYNQLEELDDIFKAKNPRKESLRQKKSQPSETPLETLR